MLVSVVIPTFNRSEVLAKALDSVLKQTLVPNEIIVVDDGSEDGTEALCAEYIDQIRFIRHKTNKGAPAARNTGVKSARGEWVAFLDSDDSWVETKLQDQLQFSIENRTEVSCTGVDYIRKNTSKKTHSTFNKCSLALEDVVWGCYFSPGSTMLVKRKLFDEYGFFDESLPRYEDWDWFLRVARHCSIGYLPSKLSLVEQMQLPDEKSVLAGLERIKRKHLSSLSKINKKLSKMLLAGIAIEMAGNAWRNRNLVVVLTNVVRSLALVPFNNRAFNVVVLGRLR